MLQKTNCQVEIGAGIALILLVGCTSKPSSNVQAMAETPVVSVIPPRTDLPKTLKLKLTLDNPQDLKVQQNDWVTKGQVIGDRTSARHRLGQEKQKLTLKLNSLKSAYTPIQQSYAVEEAKVQMARSAVVQAWDAVELFKASSPWTDYARMFLPLTQEATQFTALKAKYQAAQNNYVIARAELTAAKAQKTSAQQDTSAQQAQVLSQLENIEAQVRQLGTVLSPYDGTIKSVKWLGQTDQQLQVEVVLAVNSQRPKAKAQTSASPSSMPALPTQVPKSSGVQYAKQSSIFPSEWRVVSVHDGDTMRVSQGQKTERIRFACIDAPELKQPLGLKSREFLKRLVAATDDRVTLNIVDTDRYGRKVAEVYAGGKLIQLEAVRNGTVYVYDRYLSNCPSATALKQAQTIAQQQRLGVWAGQYQPPWEFRHSK